MKRHRLLPVLPLRVRAGCSPSAPAGRARRARSDPRTRSAAPASAPRACPTTRTGRRRSRRRARASRTSCVSSIGILAMSSPPPIRSTALSITSRLRRPEEVHLQQAERLDVPHPELRHRLLALALALERDDVGQRPVGDDDAGGVDRVLADEALERLGEVDDLAHLRVAVVGRLQLGAGLQALVEVDLRRPRGSASRSCRPRRRGPRGRGPRRAPPPWPSSSRR